MAVATVIPNPDPSVITSEAIDRRVKNVEAVLTARIEGMDRAIVVFQDNLTRVPTQLDRAVAGLRDLLEARLVSIEKTLDQHTCRFEGHPEALEKAVKVVHNLMAEELHGSANVLTEKIKSLAEVTAQQFKSVNNTFSEKDKAVSVGLSAQKESAAAQQLTNTEATNKMEANFTKLIEQGQQLLAEVRRNTDVQISDIKSQLARGEGKTSVSDPATAQKLDLIVASLASVTSSRDLHSGSEKAAADSSTKMFAIIAIIVSVAVGAAEVLTRLHN